MIGKVKEKVKRVRIASVLAVLALFASNILFHKLFARNYSFFCWLLLGQLKEKA